jgi:hypothetical protein
MALVLQRAPLHRGGGALERRYPRRGLACSALLMTAALLGGCSEEDSGTGTIQPTQLVVQPSRFLGEVECSSQTGAAHAYVVTLAMWDDLEDVEPFILGSSYPTPCSRPVAFQEVLTSRKLYTAEIDAYDVFAEDLTPFGSRSSGARHMEDITNGAPVEPRWSTRCGAGPSEGTRALTNQSRVIGHCQFLSADELGVTAIAVPPAAILGDQPCATAPTLDIVPQDSGLLPVSAVSCEAEAVVYDQGIIAGQGYSFYATTDVGDVTHGATCFATARAGLTIPVQCDPLRSTGDVRLPLDELLIDDEPACPPGYRFDVAVDGEILNATSLSCEGQTQIGPLDPGDYALDVTIFDTGGQVAGGASCLARVVAGQAVDAACSPLP